MRHIYVKTSCEPFRENTRNKHFRASTVGWCVWMKNPRGRQPGYWTTSQLNKQLRFLFTDRRENTKNFPQSRVSWVLRRINLRDKMPRNKKNWTLWHACANIPENIRWWSTCCITTYTIYIVWKRNILVHLPYCNKQLHFLFKGCNSFNYFLSLI